MASIKSNKLGSRPSDAFATQTCFFRSRRFQPRLDRADTLLFLHNIINRLKKIVCFYSRTVSCIFSVYSESVDGFKAGYAIFTLSPYTYWTFLWCEIALTGEWSTISAIKKGTLWPFCDAAAAARALEWQQQTHKQRSLWKAFLQARKISQFIHTRYCDSIWATQRLNEIAYSNSSIRSSVRQHWVPKWREMLSHLDRTESTFLFHSICLSLSLSSLSLSLSLLVGTWT